MIRVGRAGEIRPAPFLVGLTGNPYPSVMKITFLGTRGQIEASNRRHRRHSSLLVSYYDTRVMIDAGEDWLGRLDDIAPDAIVLTHAHPDHAFGLKSGAPCPVHATEVTWRDIAAYPVHERRTVESRTPFSIGDIEFEAFPVAHSTNAPAVAYRITAGNAVMVYAPDVVYIGDRAEALAGARLFVGDGATISRSMVRKPGDELIGHAPVRTQLTWCETEGVPEMIVTHCGAEIVEGDERTLGADIRAMAAERGVDVRIAHDGMDVVIR